MSLWFLNPAFIASPVAPLNLPSHVDSRANLAGPGIASIPRTPFAFYPFGQSPFINLPISQRSAGSNPSIAYNYNSINHPYYVSISELEWNSKDKQVEISFKLFTDDFEEALRHPGVKTDLLKGDAVQNKDRIQTYMRKHFQLRINDKPVTLQVIGYENDQEATWSYFQSPFPELPVKIEIVNTILYESKKEQVNIVHLKAADRRKSFRLVNPDQSILRMVGE